MPLPSEILRSIQVLRELQAKREGELIVEGAASEAIAGDPTLEGLRTALTMIDLAGERLLMAARRASAGADKWERLTDLDQYERHVWDIAFASAIVQLHRERATHLLARPVSLPLWADDWTNESIGKVARELADVAVEAYRREVGR